MSHPKTLGRRVILQGGIGLLASGCSGIMASAEASDLDLSDLEARHGGRLGLAAHDLATGRRLAWRGEERFAYCSTFKLFLAAAMLQREQSGADSLDRQVEIRREDLVPHAPVTEPVVGRSLSLEALCEGAVRTSDNAAANILLRELGGLKAFEDWYRRLGDRVTRVDRWEIELNSALPGDPRDTSLPLQMVENLRRILFDRRLSPSNLRKLKGWLIATPPTRIRAGAPEGWRVGHKTGTGPDGPANDLGVCWPPGGRSPTLLAAYFTECPGLRPAQRDAVLVQATRMAFAALARTVV